VEEEALSTVTPVDPDEEGAYFVSPPKEAEIE
jgi:hypothetical protein